MTWPGRRMMRRAMFYPLQSTGIIASRFALTLLRVLLTLNNQSVGALPTGGENKKVALW
jgi:hypothetical protein